MRRLYINRPPQAAYHRAEAGIYGAGGSRLFQHIGQSPLSGGAVLEACFYFGRKKGLF
jgi:hypothetical protein